MKNTFVILIAILLLAGCKPKSKSSLEIKSDTSKSNMTTNMPDVGELKNNTTSNNSNNTLNSPGSVSNWNKTDRDKFIQDCITKASEKVSASEAFSYCSCMTEKVEAKFPNYDEVNAKLTSADIESMRPGCVITNPSQPNTTTTTASWSAADQKIFMDNCAPDANKSLGAGVGTNYCDCMMRKLMAEYPNSSDVEKASKTHMTELAAECLRK